MKKFLSVFLVLMLLFTIVVPVFVNAIVIDDATVTMDSDVAPDPYYPFVYSEEKNYARFGEELQAKTEALIPGCLYVANLETKTIFKVIDETVFALECSTQYIYAISASQNIIRVDYSGNGYTILYKSVSQNLKALEYEDYMLYFADGDSIIKLNTQTGEVVVILEMEDVVEIYPYKEGHLLLRKDTGLSIEYDIAKVKETIITNEEQLDAILNTTIINLIPPGPELTGIVPEPDASTQAISNTYISLPMSEYPAGSYFTTTGAACSNHNSCKRYASTNQCDGFARYVNEHYYHVEGGPYSDPYSVYGDRYTTYSKYEAFGDEEGLYNFFNHLEKGAYVRVSRRTREEDAVPPYTSQGSHSFVYISHDSNGAILYEANLDDKCGVSYSYRTFDELLRRYPYFFGWVNHDQEGTPMRATDRYHRIPCSHSGCAAFVIEVHTYISTAAGYECIVCGDLTNNPNGGIIQG